MKMIRPGPKQKMYNDVHCFGCNSVGQAIQVSSFIQEYEGVDVISMAFGPCCSSEDCNAPEQWHVFFKYNTELVGTDYLRREVKDFLDTPSF